MINLGNLEFEELDEPIGVEDLFEARAEMIRQKEKASKEVGFGKAIISRDEISITKDKRGEVSGLLTTEGLKK